MINTGDATRRPSVRLLSVRGNRVATGKSLRVRASGDSGTRWRVRLPRRLGSANVMDIDVAYSAGGTANFWAGLALARPCQ